MTPLERLRTLLVSEPVFISLALRWFGWIVALAVILMEAAPAANLLHANEVLVVTGIALVCMTIYPGSMRAYRPVSLDKISPILWPVLDTLIALWSVYRSGGWDSPFYHFAITVVLAPSLRFGLAGALVSSTLYSAGYIAVVHYTELGFDPAYPGGQARPDLVSTPLNPLMIALYAAFLGEVLKKLRREMERSRYLAAENERARMARDIHDGVSQTLFMLSMSLETGQILAEKEQAEKTSKHLRKLLPVAQKALIELRNAMYNVEPLSQGEQTLAEALEQLTRDYRSASRMEIEFQVSPRFDCPPALASELFRMSQEALSNACQHSGGSAVKVSLAPGCLTIEDNGTGFERGSIKPGRGLGNLEDRAKERGVEFSLESGPEGTRVTLRWNEESS